MVVKREKVVTKKKTAKKTDSVVKKKEKKVHYEYSDFIKTTQKDIIMSHIDEIKNICEKYSGIDEAPLDVWKRLNEIVIEVSKAALKAECHGSYYILEPRKRATYTITQRVREMQRKQFILNHINCLKDNEESAEHYCNLIFLHIAIWLSENARTEKQKKEEKD